MDKIQLEVSPAELEMIRKALDESSADSEGLDALLERVSDLAAQHPAPAEGAGDAA